MKAINLKPYVDDQLFFFIEKFKEHGWNQEDTQYVCKKTDLQEWNLGIVFYCELLEYTDGGKYLNMITPWVAGEIEVKTTDEQELRKYTAFIRNELDEMKLNPFHDEDSFMGYFSKEDHKGWTKLKFYLNKHYPEGYWENHTL